MIQWLMAFDKSLFKIMVVYLYFEGAKNIHVLEVLIWIFGGCWMFLTRVWHLDLDLIWSLVFDTTMIQIPALYLDFEGAKNIHVLEVLIWGFRGRWMFLTGIWDLDLDLDIVIGL